MQPKNNLTPRQRKYNILIERYVEQIGEEMLERSTLGMTIFTFLLSPIENRLHMEREGLLDPEFRGKKYYIVKWLQCLMWAIPFLSFKKGKEIVDTFESFIWKSQR